MKSVLQVGNVLRGDWPVKFGPKMFQNTFLFFSRFWFLNMPTFRLSQYFYDICLIFMQMKAFFEPWCVCFCPVADHFTEKHSISSLGYGDFLPKTQHVAYQNVQ